MVEVAGGALVKGGLIDIDGRSLAALHRKGVKVLKEIASTEQRRYELYRDLAETLVRLRVLFRDPGGDSYAYRTAAAKIYADSGIAKDRELSLQAAVRYHIGNVLREIVPPEDLAAAGLQLEGPKERKKRRNGSSRTIEAEVVEETTREQLPERTVRLDPTRADDAVQVALESLFRAGELLKAGETGDPKRFLALLDELKSLTTKVKRQAGRTVAA